MGPLSWRHHGDLCVARICTGLPPSCPHRTYLAPPSTFATDTGFDGGENNVPLNELIAKLQPQAISADGTQLPNVARLVGSESGYAPYPVWSTTTAPARDGSGDPAGGVFCPAEADTPIAENDGTLPQPKPGQTPPPTIQPTHSP